MTQNKKIKLIKIFDYWSIIKFVKKLNNIFNNNKKKSNNL